MGWIVKFSELIGGRDCVFLFLTRFSLPGLEKYCNSCRYMVLGTWVFVSELKKVMQVVLFHSIPFYYSISVVTWHQQASFYCQVYIISSLFLLFYSSQLKLCTFLGEWWHYMVASL